MLKQNYSSRDPVMSQGESCNAIDAAALLLTCLRGLPVPAPDEMDWQSLMELATAHGVLALVYEALLEQGIEMPALFVEAAGTQKQDAERYALELERLLQEFARREVEVLPLKGPALAEMLLGDALMRLCDDLDLLVRREDFARAEGVLYEMGYIARQEADDYHRKFNRGEMLVELHFAVVSPRSFVFDLDGVWHRVRQERFRNTPAFAMWQEDMVLFLCLHGLKHGFSRLIWIVDIAYALSTLPRGGFEKLMLTAQRQGLEQALLIACEFVAETLPERYSPEMEDVITGLPEGRSKARNAVEQIFTERAGATTDPEIWGVYVQTEASARHRWLRRLMFLAPTVEDYRWARRCGIPRGVAPIVRPFRLLHKYGPARAWRILFPPRA